MMGEPIICPINYDSVVDNRELVKLDPVTEEKLRKLGAELGEQLSEYIDESNRLLRRLFSATR